MSQRYLMTQSLLNSWQYQYKSEEEDVHQEFLQTLRREPTPTNEAIQNGIAFEDAIAHYLKTGEILNEKWEKGIRRFGSIIRGGQLQLAASRQSAVGKLDVLFYGKLDALKAGTIYDIKFSKSYQTGKYFDSPQHPMYFEIVPEAQEFVYLIYDGKDCMTERYWRKETRPITEVANQFIDYLNISGLMPIYKQYWPCKY